MLWLSKKATLLKIAVVILKLSTTEMYLLEADPLIEKKTLFLE